MFKIKRNSDDTIKCYKARLVIRGFTQEYGIDYNETFSPVVQFTSIRTIVAIVAEKKLKLKQFDVKTAFLYGDLEENMFMEQPIGFSDESTKVCKLKKSLYGLKQASRCWNQKFTTFIKDFGFVVSEADPCVYVSINQSVILILGIYVDDGLIAGNDEKYINAVILHLQKQFEIKVSNVDCFLGIEIKQLDDGYIFINQSAYSRKILYKFQMADCNPVSVPSDPNQMLSNTEDEKNRFSIPSSSWLFNVFGSCNSS